MFYFEGNILNDRSHPTPPRCINMLLTVILYTPLQVTMETLSQQYIIYNCNSN